MRKCILLFILIPILNYGQLFSPIYPNAITKNNKILEYDFSNTNCFAGTGSTVFNLNGSTPSGSFGGSPIFYADPGYIKFNGSSQYLTFGDLSTYSTPVSSSNRTGVFTMNFWFNPKANNGVVISDLGQSAINSSYHTADVEMVGGYLKFSVWPKNTIITTLSTLSLHKWYFVSLVYDGTNVNAYLNGNLVGSATYLRVGPHMGSLTSAQYFSIAANDATNMGSGAYGNFLLSNIEYYAAALSGSEIYQNYLDEKPRYDLVYFLDASSNNLSYPGTGAVWKDISGYEKTATNAAGVTYKTGAGGMMYYNGTTTGYTDFSFDLGSASTVTIEMWVYPTTLSSGMFFGFNLFDVWANNGALGYNSSAGDQYGLTATQVSNLGLLNNWKHYVFIMNAGDYTTNKIYINGVSQTLSQVQGTQNTSTVNFNNGVGRIGSWLFSSSFMQTMYVKNFKVYNRALTQEEITKNFQRLSINLGPDGLTSATASSSAYQIKQDYPNAADGFYWIKNANINGGVPFKIYADMTTDGGGWTLILKNSSNSVWTYANSIEYNTSMPFSTNADITSTASASYSIIGWADYIKRSTSSFEYMIDAGTRKSFGGIWTANSNYSFTSTSNAQTNVSVTTKFGSWNYVTNNNGIAQRMPFRSSTAGYGKGYLTLSSGTGNWWGTLISSDIYYNPAPWLSDAGGGTSTNPNPGIIWYWVR